MVGPSDNLEQALTTDHRSTPRRTPDAHHDLGRTIANTYPATQLHTLASIEQADAALDG